MLAELLPAWPLIISVSYRPSAPGGLTIVGDCTVYKKVYALAPLKNGLLGSEEAGELLLCMQISAECGF